MHMKFLEECFKQEVLNRYIALNHAPGNQGMKRIKGRVNTEGLRGKKKCYNYLIFFMFI